MIKIILIAVLAFCGAYGWRQRRISHMVGAGLPIVCAMGAVLVIRPELSTQIAQYLGVGRGSDLLFYLWMAVSLLLLANVHFRLRSQNAMITLLAREIAIQQAEAEDTEV